jgi:poly(beta-D-mannuronate) lyase
MLKRIFLSVVVVFLTATLFAATYPIKNAGDLGRLRLKPGDKVVLQAGEWTDQSLVIKASGTQADPIIFTAERAGDVKLTGTSSLKVEGSWIVVDGLSFANGATSGSAVINFSDKSNNCRLTNTSIVDYNPADARISYPWISLYGTNHRVDHCYTEGKTNHSPVLVVWLSEKPNYHNIDHNYFGHRPDLGVNGGETIRIGTSTWSMYDSFTTVSNNVFYRCNGEAETVSVKSCRNKIQDNLFFETVGTLTLRHGNFNQVCGNIFIGNGIKETGGIRIIGENHQVYNNYLQGLAGTGLRSAVSIMNSVPKPALNSYWQVKNASVVSNSIINCAEAFVLGSGKDSERVVPPENVVILNNLVKMNTIPVKSLEDKADVRFSGNVFATSGTQLTLSPGFVSADIDFDKKGGLLLLNDVKVRKLASLHQLDFIPSDQVGAVLSEEQLLMFGVKEIGPSWMKFKELKVKE